MSSFFVCQPYFSSKYNDIGVANLYKPYGKFFVFPYNRCKNLTDALCSATYEKMTEQIDNNIFVQPYY